MVNPSGVVTGRYGTIGQIFFVTEPFWPLNTTLYVRDFHGNDPRFVYYLLHRFDFHSFSGKSGVPGVNRNDLHLESVTLPENIDEQRAIAAALSDVDALLGGLERLIAKKRDLKQAAMQQLLTGQIRLPGFSGEWVVMTLFDLAERKKELFDDGDWIESEHITTEGIRLIQTGNIGVGCFVEKEAKKFIYEKSFTSLRCKQLKTGDLLVCRLADPAGRACVLPDIGEERIVTSVDVTIFRPPAGLADRLYLANVFSTPAWFRAVSDRSGGTTHKRISRGALGRISVTLPPLIEQTAIAAALSDMDAELSALVTRRDKTRDLKQAMMQELLTGRTRLV
jgi:type I restriction enzyme S subunit